MPRLANKPDAGFTLLETMIALAILASVTTSLLSLSASSRRSQALAEADLSVALNLRTLLARIGRDLPLDVGAYSGRSADGLLWSVTVLPHESDGANAQDGRTGGRLLLVRISVQGETSPPSHFEIATLKRAPRT